MVWLRRILATVLLLCCGAVNLEARSYYLPDYQQHFIFGDRINSGNRTPFDSNCSIYGYYSSQQPDFDCTSISPAPGLTCYSCACSGEYIYSSANCSGDKYPSGRSCGGRQNQCLCNTSLYPYTTANCTSPKQPSGATCSDTTTHYKDCIDTTPCPSGGSSAAEKITLDGKGYTCTYSYEGYKTQCYTCTDPCDGLEDKACGSMSCQAHYPQCPSKCQTCQAAVSCDPGFHQSADKLTCVADVCASSTATDASNCGAPISNSIWTLSTTSSGRSGTKMCYICQQQCPINMENYLNWCSFGLACWTPNAANNACVQPVDCYSLGYKDAANANCGDSTYVSCPTDISKIFCFRRAEMVGRTSDGTPPPCIPADVPSGWKDSPNCGRSTIEATMDNGCGGTYYKCKSEDAVTPPACSGDYYASISCSTAQCVKYQSGSSTCKQCIAAGPYTSSTGYLTKEEFMTQKYCGSTGAASVSNKKNNCGDTLYNCVAGDYMISGSSDVIYYPFGGCEGTGSNVPLSCGSSGHQIKRCEARDGTPRYCCYLDAKGSC